MREMAYEFCSLLCIETFSVNLALNSQKGPHKTSEQTSTLADVVWNVFEREQFSSVLGTCGQTYYQIITYHHFSNVPLEQLRVP